MPRRKKEDDNRTVNERRKAFLDAYADTFSVDRAAHFAGIDPSTHHRWCRESPSYREAFRRRKAASGEWLETLCITRAGEGWLEDVFFQGSVCGQVRRFDSGLAQFLLRGMLPERYGSKTEISGPAGEPMQARIQVTFVRPGETSSEG